MSSMLQAMEILTSQFFLKFCIVSVAGMTPASSQISSIIVATSIITPTRGKLIPF